MLVVEKVNCETWNSIWTDDDDTLSVLLTFRYLGCQLWKHAS